MSKSMGYLAIARKAGRLETGEDKVRALTRAGQARLVLIASDASDNARKRVEGIVRNSRTPVVVLPENKEALSAATGEPGCAILAIRDFGLSDAFMRALASEYPGQYEQQAQFVRERAARAKYRRETRTHKGGSNQRRRKNEQL